MTRTSCMSTTENTSHWAHSNVSLQNDQSTNKSTCQRNSNGHLPPLHCNNRLLILIPYFVSLSASFHLSLSHLNTTSVRLFERSRTARHCEWARRRRRNVRRGRHPGEWHGATGLLRHRCSEAVGAVEEGGWKGHCPAVGGQRRE